MTTEQHNCKYVTRLGSSCSLNNNCKYPNCEPLEIRNTNGEENNSTEIQNRDA